MEYNTCYIADSREQELVLAIADYLHDWVEDDENDDATRNMPFDSSMRCIESYGVKFADSGDALVVNAIRHYMDIVNPWFTESIIEVLTEQCGFAEEESKKYYGMWSRGEF